MRPIGGALPLVLGVLGGAAAGALAMWLMHPGGGAVGLHDTDDHAAGEHAAEEPKAGPLQLDAKAREQAGIKVAALTGMTQQAEADGFAKGLDLSPLASIASDIVSAQAAAAASGRELARLTALAGADQSASRREVEAARAQAAADRAKLTLSCQEVTLQFGAGLARLGCDAIPGLVRAAASGAVSLVRIDIANTVLPAGTLVELGDGAGAQGDMTARVLGPAAVGDPQLQTAGALALLRGKAAPRVPVGRVVPARVRSGGATSGVLVPREAIVRADGNLFIYRDAGGDGFERVPLDNAQPVARGWFVSDKGLLPGDRVVTAGAGTLLGLERNVPAGED